MVTLGIVSAGFIVLAIGLTISRIIFDRRFTAIQKEPDQTPLFRRKVHHTQKIEQAKHIRYLLATCLIVSFVLIIFVSSLLTLAKGYQIMQIENTKMGKQIAQLEKQQATLIASIPLKNYPKEGIGLNEYEWEKLAGEKNNSDLQKQIEMAISQTTFPYFGSSDTIVSLAVPKTLSLQLKNQTDDDASKETIKRNIDAFVKEVEGLPELTDIHFRMIASVGKERQVVYSVNYSRENSENEFTKKNVSEQNLKNDGGKG